MSSNGLTEFIKGHLYPMTFNHIREIFPEMDFTLKGGVWMSPKNIDGSDPKTHRRDKSVVRERIPYRVIENGGGGSYDLIDEYKLLNGCSTYEAVSAIASIVGIPLPEMEPQQKEYWREQQQKQNALEESLKRQTAALYSPEGKATLDYLHGRGWKDEEIQKAELGFISKDEAAAMGMGSEIGTNFTLSIPLRSCGWLGGFKFRTIDPTIAKTRGKYRNPSGNSRGVFGLTGVRKEEGDVIVVEGELDALRAQANGISNVVASMGGGLSDELAKAVKEKGIKNVTLLLDNDKSGREFIPSSIKAAYTYGLRCFVALLNNGKDVDEYLGEHSADELQTIIANAQVASSYQFNTLISDFEKKSASGGEDVKEREYYTLQDDVIQLANHTPNETERDMILSMFVNCIGGQTISKEAIQAVADRERKEEAENRQKKETAKAVKEIAALSEKGDTAAALKLMASASSRLSSISKTEKYSHLLLPQKEMDIRNRMRKKPDSLATEYVFSKNGEEEVLSIPSGAITFICAPTNHGKSTLFQNIALQLAKGKEDGDILYFTYEEDGDSVLLQMLNKFIGQRLSANNLKSITSLWTRGTDKYIESSSVEAYYTGEKRFFSELIESGKLRVFYEDFDSTELVEAIESYVKQRKVKAVFIDYIQYLYKRGNKKQRTEELKDICNELKNLAIQNQLPIIVAAQLNRMASSPLELHNQNIAEAADLERIANKIICLWNSVFPSRSGESSKKDIENWESDTGIKLGQAGKIYAKITKNRGGVVGMDAVFDFYGNTGVITQNRNSASVTPQNTAKTFELGKKPAAPAEQTVKPAAEQQQLFNDKKDDCPF